MNCGKSQLYVTKNVLKIACMTCLVGFYFSPKSTGGFVDCVGLILVQPTIVDQFLHPERPRVWNLEVLLATYVFKWFSSGWFQPM